MELHNSYGLGKKQCPSDASGNKYVTTTLSAKNRLIMKGTWF
jgi:hypothetical protein